MQNTSSKFIVKYLFVLAFSLITIALINQNKNIAKKKSYSIAFLNVSDHIVDSIISFLSTDEKIELMLSTKAFFIDSTDYNMITDTVFLEDYFNGYINQNSVPKPGYYSYKISSSKFADLTDSTFLKFITKRYQFIDRLLQKKELLTGMYYSYNLLNQLSGITDTAQYQYRFQQQLLKKNVGFHVFEYLPNKIIADVDFDGLLVIHTDSLLILSNEIAKTFLDSHFNIFYLSEKQKILFKTIIKNLLDEKPAYKKNIDLKIRKIIKAQYWLNNKKATNTLINNQLTKFIRCRLKEKSTYIAYNLDSVLPLKNTSMLDFNIIWISGGYKKGFLNIFKNYALYNFYQPKHSNEKGFLKLKSTVKNRTNIIVVDNNIKDSTLLNNLSKLLELCPKRKTIIINFGCFDNLKILPDSFTIVQMPGNAETDFLLAPQVLFGAIDISARVPYTINQQIKFGRLTKIKANRLAYSVPEIAGLNSEKLAIIDEIARQGVANGAFPGCQVFVAKNGRVVYNKSFGYHTYSKRNRVKPNDVYDLASVTKIAATTIASMKMVSDGKINLGDMLGNFFKDTHIDYTRIKPDTIIKIDTFYTKTISKLPEFLIGKDTVNINDSAFTVINTAIFKLTPKRNIFKVKLLDLLKHKSGILPVVPIFRYIYYRQKYLKKLIGQHKGYKKEFAKILNLPQLEIPDSVILKLSLPDSLQFLLNQQLKNNYFRYFSKIKIADTSDHPITGHLFLKNVYFDTLWNDIKQLPVYKNKFKEYSDINMVLLQMAIDSLNNMSIDKYLKTEIYKPLGLKSISYLPLTQFNKNKVIPTEIDNTWRYGLLHGYVHDPSSALLGGVAGNAGLYSNAHNLGILFQMVLNGGSYGGHQYIDSKTISQFTKRFDDTQRALGFDMPNRKAVVGGRASKSTYGHSGYTGTCVWVDPENDLVYVFLSNRNHPSSKNWKIINYHIRERIHDAIYNAME